MTRTLKHYIGGQWVASSSDKTTPVINPATCEVLAHVPEGTREDVDRAAKAASAAFEKFLKDYPASSLKPNAEFGQALAVSGTDRAKGLTQLKAFAEQNRTHPFATDALRVISQIEK